MQKRRLITRDGVETDFIPTGDGGFVINTHTDVQPLLDQNQRNYDGDRMARRKSEFRHVAEIDAVIFLKWLREDGITMKDLGNGEAMTAYLKKKLNDPDNAKFRVGPERL